MIRFVIAMVCTACVLGGGTYAALHLEWIESLPSFFAQTLIIVVFTTGLLYAYLLKARQPEFFVQLYLLTIAFKMLAYGGYIVWMILDDKPGATVNVAFFLILYLSFTVLEIAFLYRKITRQTGQNSH